MNKSRIIADAAWTWFNDPRAIFINANTILIGYVSGDGQPGLSSYNTDTHVVNNFNIGTALSKQRDDHNNPALTVLSNGNVLMVYSRHGSDKEFFFRISNNSNPLTIDDWSHERCVARGSPTTYANLLKLSTHDTNILNIHRCINWNPTLSIYNEINEDWDEPLPFIKTGNGKVRPYFKLTSDGVARIHVIYTDHHPNNFNNSIYHFYFEVGKFFDSQGNFLKAIKDGPLEHDLGQRGSLVYEYKDESLGFNESLHDFIPMGRAWVWEISLSQDGRPVCVFSICKRNTNADGWLGDRIYYYWAILTSDGWIKRCIANAGRPLYDKERDYAAGICLDKNNPFKVYLCSNALNPFDISLKSDEVCSEDLRSSYDMFELTLKHDFDVEGRILFHGNSYRPYSVLSESKRSVLLWLSGKYDSYKNFETNLNIQIIN